MTMIFVLEKYVDYEGSVVIGVFTDIDVANASLAVYRQLDNPDDCTYSLESHRAQVEVPTYHTWWRATAHRSSVHPPTVRAWECSGVSFDPPPAPYVTLTNDDDHIDNPHFVKGTPNARIPDTPGGRFISVKARQVDCIETTEELAIARALAALGTDPLCARTTTLWTWMQHQSAALGTDEL